MAGAHRYVIALGSNMRHPRHGHPRDVVAAAVAAMGRAGLVIEATSPIITSVPLGPSQRLYANAAVAVRTDMPPDALLDLLQQIELTFGRERRGQRWSARVLDLDIVLWNGGAWASDGLVIPHIHFRTRAFVVTPAAAIAPLWRDPQSGLSLRQLSARLTRRARLPIGAAWRGP